MTRFPIPSIIIVAGAFLLSGCAAVGRWAERTGEYMPVVGERCHHWQCLTPAGQRRSDMIRDAEEGKIKPTTPAGEKVTGVPMTQPAPRAAAPVPAPVAPTPDDSVVSGMENKEAAPMDRVETAPAPQLTPLLDQPSTPKRKQFPPQPAAQ